MNSNTKGLIRRQKIPPVVIAETVSLRKSHKVS